MDAIPLNRLLLRVRRSLALNFPVPLWVKCEVSQITERRGHRYLQLVEKGEDVQALAKCQAALWSKTYQSVIRKRGQMAADVLVAGQEVCLQVTVDFSELYGLKLVVEDWDPAFTIGQLELRRLEILETLRSAGLLRKNAGHKLPPVLQRLAVISSAKAAGYADFIAQLAQNQFGYHFSIELFDSSVQGINTEPTIVSAIDNICIKCERFDAVAILRGGGSRMDLASFDTEGIGRAIANCGLPVLVGIGHEVDETIPDLVAHTALKTPTALAEFIISTAANYESRVIQATQQIARFAERLTTQKKSGLAQIASQLQLASTQSLLRQQSEIETTNQLLQLATKQAILQQGVSLSSIEDQLLLLNPASTLARGYTMISKGKERILAAAALSTNDVVTLHFADGQLESKIL